MRLYFHSSRYLFTLYVVCTNLRASLYVLWMKSSSSSTSSRAQSVPLLFHSLLSILWHRFSFRLHLHCPLDRNTASLMAAEVTQMAAAIRSRVITFSGLGRLEESEKGEKRRPTIYYNSSLIVQLLLYVSFSIKLCLYMI